MNTMTIKEKMLQQLDLAKEEFTGERLKVIHKAYEAIEESNNINQLLTPSDDNEVRKMIRVVYHDAIMTPSKRKLLICKKKNLKNILTGSLMEKEKMMKNKIK